MAGRFEVPWLNRDVELLRLSAGNSVETELWVYPGAGHGLSEPAHQVHKLETWLAWYERALAR